MTFVRIRSTSGQGQSHIDPASKVLSAEEVMTWVGAQDVIRAAQEEADRIREQAKKEYQQELERGYRDGLEQAQMEQVERMIENASRMVDFFSTVEQRMVSLVMQAVRRIVADFDDHERVMTVVQSGLAVMRNQKQLTLRLAPEHLETVRARAAELLEKFPGVGMIDFVSDSRLKGDAAIFESEIGVVEASLEAQLAALEKGFVKMLGSRT
jgi:type III secretion protein L